MRELLLRPTLLEELLCISLKGSLFWTSIQIGRSKGFLKHTLELGEAISSGDGFFYLWPSIAGSPAILL